MGDPSYFVAVRKNFVLNWGRLSARRRQAILKVLHEMYKWESASELPRTFEELMKAFDECKFYGYLDRATTAVLSEWLPIFPETGYALFIACDNPVTFVFDPSAQSYQILVADEGWPCVCPYQLSSLLEEHNKSDCADEKCDSEEKVEKDNEDGDRHDNNQTGKENEDEGEGYEEEDEEDEYDAEHRVQTRKFHDEVLLPFFQLPSTQDPALFLRQHGFRTLPPPSQEEMRALDLHAAMFGYDRFF